MHGNDKVTLAGPQELADETERLISRPLPSREHPAWDWWLLAAKDEPERFRVCFRNHHGLLDGVGAAHTVLALLADTPVSGPRLFPPSLPTAAETLQLHMDLAASLVSNRGWREFTTRRPGPPSRWDHRDMAVTRLRALADTYGASVNDVSLAALALALRDWRAQHSPAKTTVQNLTVAVPVSTRLIDQQYAPGNHLTLHRLRLPCTATNLREAVERVQQRNEPFRRTRKRDAARVALSRPLPARLAGPLLRAMSGPRSYPLMATSVTFPEQFTCFGSPLDYASLFFNVSDDNPICVGFTRTPSTLRCTVNTDHERAAALTIPVYWARALDEAGTL